MARLRSCRACGDWHALDAFPRECVEQLYTITKRSNLPLPFIRRDHMDALWHPGDGREYTSRSDYDAVTREKGLLEIGDADLSKEVKPFEDNTIKDDVIQAYKQVSEGYKPAPLATDNATTGWQEPA